MLKHPTSTFPPRFNRLKIVSKPLRSAAALGLISLAIVIVPSAQAGAPVIIQVPSQQPSLQAAINAIPEDGIIEIAAGNYPAPGGGYTAYFDPAANPARSFTIRAATGATVVLDGVGSTDILRATNSVNKTITFQGLTFANGRTTDSFIGGAITLVRAQAIFKNCIFQNNAANGSLTGGGALWLDTAVVSFDSCTLSGNTSPNYAGGLSALNSTVYIRNCRFAGNRCDLPNHKTNAAGGVMQLRGSIVRIANSSFDDNHAGLVGGAIYTFGDFQDPVTTPSVDLTVSDTTFTGNTASRDPSVTLTSPTAGGAIHVEDQTTARFYNCRFTNNSARQGGAISSYRAITEFEGCLFKGNLATGTGAAEGIGGTIISQSADNSDGSTNFGHTNRRAAVLTIRDSLIQGPGTTTAREGGGIFAAGDLGSAYGLAGIQPNGTPEENHAVVNLTRVVFDGLTATGAAGTPGTGGALKGDFMTLNADKCIVQNCAASDWGGGFQFGRISSVNTSGNTFIGNFAGVLGGAITMFGGALNMTSDNLVENRVGSGGRGAAITTSADAGGNGLPATDMSGVLKSCVISNNTGGATIYDGDGANAPFNRLQYSTNQIFPGSGSAFYSDTAGPKTVQELNALSIPRNDGTTTVKAPLANIVPSSAPVVGAILLVPTRILQSGAPGEGVPISASLAYAASGSSVVLDGTPQNSNRGVVSTLVDNVHTLAVNGISFATSPPQGAAANIATRLPVGTGQNVLIGGFIIQGPSPKRVIIRAIGPSLNGILPGALQDPTLELHDGTNALIARNDNWRSTQLSSVVPSDQAVEIQGTGVAPTNDAESAIIATLNPGNYSAVISGASNSTGIAVVEAYDLDPIPTSKLANISTRGFVAGGNDVLIAGFIYLGGSGATKIVVRGIGPSLTDAGIANPLADPTLEVRDAQGMRVDSNDDWRSSSQAGAISAAGLAPAKDVESAILLQTPAHGAYSAILQGKTGPGVGVVEVYVF